MPYIVTENCIMCKHTSCVGVCPVDCFYEGPNFLVINPDECIDCGLCEPECPIKAIKAHDNLAPEHRHFAELNRELSKHWPNITQVKDPLPDAPKWDGVADKLRLLVRDAPPASEAQPQMSTA